MSEQESMTPEQLADDLVEKAGQVELRDLIRTVVREMIREEVASQIRRQVRDIVREVVTREPK